MTRSIVAVLALAASTAQAVECSPNPAVLWGVVGTVAWGDWLCRPVDRTHLTWGRNYAFYDLMSGPPGAGAVYDKWRAGDHAGALAGGKALANKLSTDPLFAKAKAAADAARAKAAPVYTNITAAGQPCDCRKATASKAFWWACPLVASPATTAQCKPT